MKFVFIIYDFITGRHMSYLYVTLYNQEISLRHEGIIIFIKYTCIIFIYILKQFLSIKKL